MKIQRRHFLRDVEPADRERFQTLYAKEMGAVAAPSAGLHFSKELLKRLELKGINFAELTLHTGLGTFRSIDVEDLSKHKMDAEYFKIQDLKLAEGWTNLFIYPPFEFTIANTMITNFHLPKSSLAIMACAFGGRDLILSAYEEAIKEKYRFFSYGDAMMIV